MLMKAVDIPNSRLDVGVKRYQDLNCFSSYHLTVVFFDTIVRTSA